MNQLKLLNFHKMIANFANNLVGAFVPLIIYQATNSLPLAFAYLVSNNALRLLFTLSFKKLYPKYPQLFLLLRLIPIALYNIFIFVLDYNLVIGVIGVCVFLSLDYSINGLSKEIIFNYSSLTQKSDKTIGVTRLFEQTGIIIALLVGGFLLDFNKTIVLILSLSIYLISVIPLVIYYIKSKNSKTFNKDAISNAVNTLNKSEKYKNEGRKLTKKILLSYAISYFSFAFVDLLQTSYSLFVFSQQGEFSTAGIINAIFNCFYGLGFYTAGIINEKKDTSNLVRILCIVIAVSITCLPFIDLSKYFLIICGIYGIIGFSYPFLSLFVLERLLIKSRIMACSNSALYARETSCVTAYIVGYSSGFIGLIALFITIGIVTLSSSIIIPQVEESTRKTLVDYLQKNETSSK